MMTIWKVHSLLHVRSSWDAPRSSHQDPGEVPWQLPSQSRQRHPTHYRQESWGGVLLMRYFVSKICQNVKTSVQVFSLSSSPPWCRRWMIVGWTMGPLLLCLKHLSKNPGSVVALCVQRLLWTLCSKTWPPSSSPPSSLLAGWPLWLPTPK